MGSETANLQQAMGQFTTEEIISILPTLVLMGLFIALLSFRFFKIEVTLSALYCGYQFGAFTLGAAIGDSGAGIGASIILGVACAIIVGLLALKFYKALIFITGGLLGGILVFSIAEGVMSLIGIAETMPIVGAVCALALFVPLAKLFVKAFKPFYIILSSWVGCIILTVSVGILFGVSSETVLGVLTVLSIVLAVFASRIQFKINRGRAAFD
jgi:hypothetical protein